MYFKLSRKEQNHVFIEAYKKVYFMIKDPYKVLNNYKVRNIFARWKNIQVTIEINWLPVY